MELAEYKMHASSKEMFLFHPHSKDFQDKLFLKKLKRVKTTKQKNPLTKDYKFLLYLCFLWQLPYTSSQLLGKSCKENKVLNFLTVLANVIKTLLGVTVIIYSRLLFFHTSLVLMYSVYLFLTSVASWTVFLKHGRILQAIKMMITVTSKVNPRKFKSKWKINLFLFYTIVGTVIFAATVGKVSLQTYATMNCTSSHFFWYEITAEYERAFSWALVLITDAALISLGFTSGQAILLISTLYFHLGDTILNFEVKLKKRLEHQEMNHASLLQNLSEFQRIKKLNDVLNDAVSYSVAIFYGANISLFFAGICLVRSYGFETIDNVLLVVSVFIFSVYSFFMVTLAGDRVKGKYDELKHSLNESFIFILNRAKSDVKQLEWFSYLSTELRSCSLQVHGGNMFTISSSLILHVTATLITYGVILFQMD